MKKPPQRLCIYPKDIMRITGKGERFSRDLLFNICKKLNKQKHQFVSIEEFCNYTGLDIQKVMELIKD